MKSSIKTKLIYSLLLAGAAFAPASAQTVANGGFELSAPAGQVSLSPWTIDTLAAYDVQAAYTGVYTYAYPFSDGGGLYFRTADAFTPVSPEGGNYLLASGFDAASNPFKISQTITGLTAGNTYNVNFYQGTVSVVNWTGDSTGWWQVGFGGATQNSQTMMDSAAGGTNWQSQSLTFTASGDTQELSFTSLGSSLPWNALDGISVTPAAVPEPSGAVLVGSVGLLYLLRRRRRA